jgi:hypothetical protein
MSAFQIKLLAIVFMFLDHVGAYLFPDLVWLRIVGRLSFPLFGWLIANGYRHTSNANRYLYRFLLFAFISQIPFALVGHTINDPLANLNIFFTLWIGLAAISLSDRFAGLPAKVVILILGIFLGWVLPVDYGAAGVLSIIAFHFSFNRHALTFGLQLCIFTLFYTVPLLIDFSHEPSLMVHPIRLWQPFAATSTLFIALYDGRKGYSMKYFFYLFYPLHLLLLYWLQQLLATQ